MFVWREATSRRSMVCMTRWAPRGRYEVAFVHTDGRRLVKRIDVRDEVYIGVSFSEMRVTGGE